MTSDNTGGNIARTVGAAEFEAKCLELIDEVAESGDEIVITKDGRPVSRLVPYGATEKAGSDHQRDKIKNVMPFGRLRGEIDILEDIVAPMPSSWFEDPDGSDKELF